MLMGVDGVIVDLVQEITEVVAEFGKENMVEEENDEGIKCSEKQLSSLMEVIGMKYICS